MDTDSAVVGPPHLVDKALPLRYRLTSIRLWRTFTPELPNVPGTTNEKGDPLRDRL
jgi:hypothetical protein